MLSFQSEVFGGVEAYSLKEGVRRDPGPDEIEMRVHTVGLGFVDTLLTSGRYQIRPELPYVPGGEIAGTVEKVGRNSKGLKVGDRVAAWQLGGGLSQWAIVKSEAAVPVPSSLGLDMAAATLLDFQTATYALEERAAIKAGEVVLVMGASGGVGAAAVQIAASKGAFVIASASSDEKRAYAAGLGASALIDPAADDFRAGIREASPTAAIDIVVDPVGGVNFERCFRSLAPGGRHLVVGFAGGPIPSLPANLALLKSASLVGVDLRNYYKSRPGEAIRSAATVLARLASGELAGPKIDLYEFADAAKALKELSRRSRYGKILVKVDETEG